MISIRRLVLVNELVQGLCEGEEDRSVSKVSEALKKHLKEFWIGHKVFCNRETLIVKHLRL